MTDTPDDQPSPDDLDDQDPTGSPADGTEPSQDQDTQDGEEADPGADLIAEVDSAPPSILTVFPEGFDPEEQAPLDDAALPKELRTRRPSTRKSPKINPGLQRYMARRRVLHAVKAQQAVQYRLLGYSYDRIAQELGYKGRQGAYEAVKAILARRSAELADEALSLDLERLDALMVSAMSPAIAGDLTAVGTVQSLISQRQKMLGLEKPTKVAATNAAGGDLPAGSWAAGMMLASAKIAALTGQGGGLNMVEDEPDVPEEGAGNTPPV